MRGACYTRRVIGRVDISLTAAAPNRNLPPVAVLQGSAATFAVAGVGDAVLRGLALQVVVVTVVTPDGVATSANASRRGDLWLATFAGGLFATVGTVAGGVTVSVVGTDEIGRSRSWVVGVADIDILQAEPIPAAGESWQCVRLLDGVSNNPHEGDLVNADGHWRLYAAGAWVDFATVADAEGAASYGVFDATPGGTGGAAVLRDRAINEVVVTLDDSGEANVSQLVMPAAVEDRARDFLVRLDLSDVSAAPPLTFSSGAFETADGFFPAIPAGQVTLLSFSETTPGVFAVAARRLLEVS